MTPEQLKASILQYAIQGKLVEQRPEEGTGEELYQKMQTDKQTLIREKKIKKEKPLPDIIDNEIPFDVPESWKWVKVGNVGSWSSGATPSRTNPAYYGGSIPWLKTGDLNDGFIQEVPEYITDLALEKTSLRLNPIGSVLMAMYGATIGKLGILEIPVTTNQACCACIPYAGMNNKYLFYYLMSMRQSYIGMAEGGAQPNISKEKIVNSLIPLPPAAEQASKGNVVAIQIGSSLNIDIYHKVRLVNIEDYNIGNYDEMAGFIAGILASDYDCTDIFVDGILRICGRDMEKIGAMFDKIAAVSGENTHITFTISAEVADLTENIKKYLK